MSRGLLLSAPQMQFGARTRALLLINERAESLVEGDVTKTVFFSAFPLYYKRVAKHYPASGRLTGEAPAQKPPNAHGQSARSPPGSLTYMTSARILWDVRCCLRSSIRSGGGDDKRDHAIVWQRLNMKIMELVDVGERVFAAECIQKRRIRKVSYPARHCSIIGALKRRCVPLDALFTCACLLLFRARWNSSSNGRAGVTS